MVCAVSALVFKRLCIFAVKCALKTLNRSPVAIIFLNIPESSFVLKFIEYFFLSFFIAPSYSIGPQFALTT